MPGPTRGASTKTSRRFRKPDEHEFVSLEERGESTEVAAHKGEDPNRTVLDAARRKSDMEVPMGSIRVDTEWHVRY